MLMNCIQNLSMIGTVIKIISILIETWKMREKKKKQKQKSEVYLGKQPNTYKFINKL